jgi:hypothetical protein
MTPHLISHYQPTIEVIGIEEDHLVLEIGVRYAGV